MTLELLWEIVCGCRRLFGVLDGGWLAAAAADGEDDWQRRLSLERDVRERKMREALIGGGGSESEKGTDAK